MKEVMPNGREDTRTSRADVTGAAHPSNAGAAGGREESPWREIACEIAGRHIVIRVEDIEEAIELGYNAGKHLEFRRKLGQAFASKEQHAAELAALLEQKGAK
jgi:hypothetical protein